MRSGRARDELEVRSVASPEELVEALEIRRRVFVDEQGIPAELDADGLDDDAHHVIVLDGEQVVATGRLRVDDPDCAVAARIAVLPSHRGKGLGQQVVTALGELARQHGARRVQLSPHEYLERFYLRLGYRTIDGAHFVGEHRLITMEKQLYPS